MDKLGIPCTRFCMLHRNLRRLDDGRVGGREFGLDGEGAGVDGDVIGRGGDDSQKIVPARCSVVVGDLEEEGASASDDWYEVLMYCDLQHKSQFGYFSQYLPKGYIRVPSSLYYWHKGALYLYA